MYFNRFYSEKNHWTIIPDLSDIEYKLLANIYKIKHIIKYVGTEKEYFTFRYNIIDRENEIRESGDIIDSQLLSIQIHSRTHVKYAERFFKIK